MKKALHLLQWTFLSAILLMSSFQGFSQALLVENFDFPAGSFLNAVGWKAHSGTAEPVSVVVPGLTFPGYPLSGIGGAAALDNNGEDVNKTFALQTSGTVYASFMVKADALVDGYFLHLGGDPTGTTFRGKVFTSGTADPFNFGLSVGSNTATTMTGGAFTKGTTYLFVLKYEIVEGEKNDVVSLYIITADVPATEPANPSIGPLTDGSQTDIIPGSIALRQYNAGQKITIDGIRVAKTWADAVTAPAGGDVTPPVFSSGFPKVTNIKSTSVDLQVSLDEPGKVYFVVIKDGDPAPSAEQVFLGTAPEGAISGGSADVAVAGEAYTSGVSFLTDRTHYDAWFVATDDEPTPNKQTQPVLVKFFTEQPRDTLLYVNFETSLEPFQQVSIKGDQLWTPAQYNNNGYAYLNGYSGSARENEDWLVSPAITGDKADNIGFSFRTAKNYSGPDLKVLISDMFNGSYTPDGIAAAIWTPVTQSFTFSAGSFTWVPSGLYTFGAFLTGKYHVAFVYESTTSGAAAWEVDDFLISGHKWPSGLDPSTVGKILLYPVPARSQLTIDHAEEVTRVEIFDLAGRLQLSQATTGQQKLILPVGHLQNGMYLVRIMTPRGPEVQKFVKE